MVCDRIGRVWATRQLCLVWILGIAIYMGNGGSLAAVYAGRFIAGLGVGQTVVVGPVYLAEIVSVSTVASIVRGLTENARLPLLSVAFAPVSLLVLFIWASYLLTLLTMAARSV